MAEDKIFIRDLLLRTVIGLNDWERKDRQDVLLNVTLFPPMRADAAHDDAAHVLNYRTITKAIIAHVESSAYYTVEALADAVARICVVEHNAKRAIVRVEKPGALRFARSVGVEVERERADYAERPGRARPRADHAGVEHRPAPKPAARAGAFARRPARAVARCLPRL